MKQNIIPQFCKQLAKNCQISKVRFSKEVNSTTSLSRTPYKSFLLRVTFIVKHFPSYIFVLPLFILKMSSFFFFRLDGSCWKCFLINFFSWQNYVLITNSVFYFVFFCHYASLFFPSKSVKKYIHFYGQLRNARESPLFNKILFGSFFLSSIHSGIILYTKSLSKFLMFLSLSWPLKGPPEECGNAKAQGFTETIYFRKTA